MTHKSDYFACIESQLLNIMNVELPFSLLDVGDHGYCPSLLLERPKYVIIYNILSYHPPSAFNVPDPSARSERFTDIYYAHQIVVLIFGSF